METFDNMWKRHSVGFKSNHQPKHSCELVLDGAAAIGVSDLISCERWLGYSEENKMN